MCTHDHKIPIILCLASSELAVRALVFKDEIGLSPEQVDKVVGAAKAWRVRYVELAEQATALGLEVDDKICKYHADVPEVDELIDRRIDVMRHLDHEFVRAWESINATLTPEQHDALDKIYRREYRSLPHPAFGTTAEGPPLGSRKPEPVAAR